MKFFPSLRFYIMIFVSAFAALEAITACAPHFAPTSADLRPTINSASVEVQKQNGVLTAQNQLLQQQVQTLQTAVDAATATGSLIDKAKGQGAKAAAAGAGVPDVVTNLADQSKTLDGAMSSNGQTASELRAAQDENGKLKSGNAALAASNVTLSGQLKTLTDQAAAGEKEKAGLRAQVAELTKEKEEGRLTTLYHYFGLSIAALIAGLAAAIWIPSPGKTAGYVLATMGGVGLAVTVFLIVWMKVFVWLVLAAFVASIGYIACQLWKTHGALVKTSQGVDGIKQDLQTLVSSSPAAEVRTAAGTILRDWFGSIENDFVGIFHWLHSEYEAVIARVRSLIGSKPAAAPAPNMAAAVNGPANILTKGV
jgi:hypothetical protein